MEVRIRLGSGIAQFAPAPVLTVQLPNGATIDDLCDQLASSNPQLGASLGSALTDPRFLDLSLDTNERPVGSVWGTGANGARGEKPVPPPRVSRKTPAWNAPPLP